MVEDFLLFQSDSEKKNFFLFFELENENKKCEKSQTNKVKNL